MELEIGPNHQRQLLLYQLIQRNLRMVKGIKRDSFPLSLPELFQNLIRKKRMLISARHNQDQNQTMDRMRPVNETKSNSHQLLSNHLKVNLSIKSSKL
jgi:hypothetical protein